MDPLLNRQVTHQDVERWYKLKSELEALKNEEALLRSYIFNGMFPTPVEGTNRVALDDHYDVKAVHKINRAIDEVALANSREYLLENGVPVTELIKWKPELVGTIYKKLSPTQMQAFDNVLVIKTGTPSLDIVPRKMK